jgi:hypothetical protein
MVFFALVQNFGMCVVSCRSVLPVPSFLPLLLPSLLPLLLPSLPSGSFLRSYLPPPVSNGSPTPTLHKTEPCAFRNIWVDQGV